MEKSRGLSLCSAICLATKSASRSASTVGELNPKRRSYGAHEYRFGEVVLDLRGVLELVHEEMRVRNPPWLCER
jgi:hypothetical protein